MNYVRQYYFKSVIFIFLMLTIIPGVCILIQEPAGTNEKRALNPLPKLPTSLDSLRRYPGLFDSYYQDHMAFRNWLTSIYSRVLLFFNTSPVKTVILGRDDWLFYAGEQVIKEYQNVSKFNQIELLQWARVLENKQKALAEKGIKYLFIVAPNKHTIYPEMLPRYIVKQDNESQLDQLLSYLRKNTTVNFLDLRPALLEAKKSSSLLYWPRDTHWNRKGAYIAQMEVAEKLRSMGSSIPYHVIKSNEWIGSHYAEQDLKRMLGGNESIKEKEVSYEEGFFPCVAIEDESSAWEESQYKVNDVYESKCDNGNYDVLVFRDSFAIDLIPYFANYFKVAKYVWTLPDFDTFEYFLSTDLDIVIEERVERSLKYVSPSRYWRFLYQKYDSQIYAKSFDGVEGSIFKLDDENIYALEIINAEKYGRTLPINIETTHWDSQIITSNINFIHNRKYLLHVILDSTSDTVAQLFYKDSIRDDFNSDNVLSRKVVDGINSLYFELTKLKTKSNLRFDPGTVKGSYIVKKFEIKEIPI